MPVTFCQEWKVQRRTNRSRSRGRISTSRNANENAEPHTHFETAKRSKQLGTELARIPSILELTRDFHESKELREWNTALQRLLLV